MNSQRLFRNACTVAHDPDLPIANKRPMTDDQRKAMFARGGRGGGGGGRARSNWQMSGNPRTDRLRIQREINQRSRVGWTPGGGNSWTGGGRDHSRWEPVPRSGGDWNSIQPVPTPIQPGTGLIGTPSPPVYNGPQPDPGTFPRLLEDRPRPQPGWAWYEITHNGNTHIVAMPNESGQHPSDPPPRSVFRPPPGYALPNPGMPTFPGIGGGDIWAGGTPPWIFDPRTGGPNHDALYRDPNLQVLNYGSGRGGGYTVHDFEDGGTYFYPDDGSPRSRTNPMPPLEGTPRAPQQKRVHQAFQKPLPPTYSEQNPRPVFGHNPPHRTPADQVYIRR